MKKSDLENVVRSLINIVESCHPDEISMSDRHFMGELYIVIDRAIFGGKYGELRGMENALYDIRRSLHRLEDKRHQDYPRCELSKCKDGAFPEFISTMTGSAPGEISPNPDSFLKRLGNIVRSGSVAVIVDPYILSAKDDTNTLVDVLSEVVDITKNSEGVYLFCRKENIDEPTLSSMKQNLGIKLKGIFTGDIHDRYVFVGHDQKIDNSYHRPWIPGKELSKPGAKEIKYWRGAAFGASLNGVTKRPTYILNFSGEDLGSLFAYLDSEMISLK